MKVKRQTLPLRSVAFAAACCAMAGSAFAVDFDGYMRVGPGLTSASGASRACYNLGIEGGHYRLGDECNFYGEFGLAQTANVNGATYTAKVMFNEFNNGTDQGTSYTSFEQLYVEAKGLDVSPTTAFWTGKRFYGRENIDMLDKFFVNMSGVGGGADFSLGGDTQLGVAFFTSDSGQGLGDSGSSNSTNPGLRMNVDLRALPVNAGGTLRATFTYTDGRFSAANNPNAATPGAGTTGVGLGLTHTQALPSIGGDNRLWLQYAQGSAGLNGNFGGFDGNFGSMSAPSSAKAYLLVDGIHFSSGQLEGVAHILVGKHDYDGTVAGNTGFNELSVGGRIAYGITRNFKIDADLGFMQKKPFGGATQNLTKFTIAPTLSVGKGLYDRPELRFFVTHASWNAAAGAAGGGTDGVRGAPTLNDVTTTNGTSIGIQAEVWF